ncbi:hypothetical protein [Streptomyces sp. NPDC059224]|uniref:hypothetical protein n=1 Tax=Streptomyces sp. NPDC059224 TaxID=3346775 RepID=UPI0036935D6E
MPDGTLPGMWRRQWERALHLQTALLQLDFSVDEVSVRESENAPDTATKGLSRLSRDLREVVSAFQNLKEDSTAGLRRVPSWLGPTGDGTVGEPGGLGLLRRRLTSGTPVWDEILQRLKAGPEWFLLMMLEREWTDLTRGDASQSPAAAEPTVPDPEPDSEITVVFPMVHSRGSGFLVEMVLRPRDTAGPAPAANHQPTAKFSQAVGAACRAALKFAEGVGVPQENIERWQQYDVTFDGIPPSIRPDDTSASAPTAVALTARLLGLPSPRQLVTGEIRDDGTLGSLPTDGQLVAKKRAAREHDLDLLPLLQSWQLPDIGVQLWGPSWYDALSRAAQCGLRHLEHEVCTVTDVRNVATDDDWDFTPVRLEVVDDILVRVKAGAPAIVVGGPRSSARTTAARQAALTWATEHGTPVVEIRLNDGTLPTADVLQHVIGLARYAQQIRPGTPALVILEDLIPYEDSADLDAVLPSAAEQTSSTIIAVCLYLGGNRWQTNGLATVPSLYRPDDLRKFSKQFARLNDLSQDDSSLSIALRSSDGDIWWLVRLLRKGWQLSDPGSGDRPATLARAATAITPAERTETQGGTPPRGEADTFTAVRRAYVRRAHNRATRKWLKQMKTVAAASLLRISVPEAFLGGMPADRLMRAGAQRDRMGRWYIYRSATCRALLASEEGMTDPTEREWKRTADAQYEALAELIREQPRVYDEVLTRFITGLLKAAKTMDDGLHLRLLEVSYPTLALIAADAPPAVVANALLACGSDGPDKERQRLFETLIRCIFAAGWQAMNPRQAGTCLRAIRSYRDFADWGIRRKYQEVLEQLSRGMRRVLVRTDPVQGLFFVQELGRLWEETTRREILALAVGATTRCDPRQVEHYRAVVRLVDASMKYGDDRGAVVNQFVRASGVKRLLTAETPNDAGLVFARAALRLLLDRPAGTTDQLRRWGAEAARSLNSSLPTSVIIGLSQLEQIDLSAARIIVQASEMDTWLRTTLRRTEPDGLTPWHVAQLVRRLGRVDTHTVLRILYRPGREATTNQETLDALVHRVIEMGDLKGVGHVVSAVASVDMLWGPGGPDSAAARLCARLEEFVNKSLQHENRGSVVLAVVSALLEANIPPVTLRALLHRCADVVVTEIRDSQKEHGPRLALLLGQHPTVGPVFLDLLADRIQDKQLLDRMTRSYSLDARGAYMDLARALHRTMDDKFVDSFLDQDWLEQSKPELRGGSVLKSLIALRAFTRLLRDMGIVLQDREEGVLRAVDSSTKWWAERLKRLYHPGQWSQALHILHQLAPEFAVDCLRELDALYRPETKYGGRLSVRQALVTETRLEGGQDHEIPKGPSPARIAMLQRRRAAVVPPHRGLAGLAERRFIQPAETVELIYAVRTIDGETGRSMGTAVSNGENWERRIRALLDTDEPEQLGIQLRMMADTRLHLPKLHRDRLFRRWQAEARDFRSPATAQSLICGFAASGEDGPALAERLAGSLDLGGIASRLGRGLSRDLAMAPAFIRALDIWGPAGSADSMAAALPVDAVARVEVADAVNLLLALMETRPNTFESHIKAAADALSNQVSRHYVRDPEAHWREVGWLIRITREAGGSVPDPDAILDRIAVDCRRPEIAAWVEGCLGRFPDPECWLLDDAAAWTEPARLLVHSELAPPETPPPGRLNTLLRRASLRWQVQLLHRAVQDAELRSAFAEDDLEELTKLGEYQLTIGRPSGTILLRAVEEVARAHSEGH